AIGDKEVMEGNIYDAIQSLRNSDFAGKLEVIGGELLLNRTDKVEIEVAKSLDIRVNPYLILDGVLLSAETNLALMDESGVLTLPESVKKIGNGAFANLSGLKTIIIPGTVKEIGQNAFTNNADLTRVVLQEGIEIIGIEAFRECDNLTTIELPESLRSIGAGAFQACSKLDNVTIPSQITRIEGATFYECKNLTTIKLPENLGTIEGDAFSSCSSLKSIYIPKNVNSIANNSFTNCTKLTNIEIAEENTKYSYNQDSGMLMDLENNNILFISSTLLNNITSFSIPEGITNFNIFISSYSNITTLIIPKSLEKISNAQIFPTSLSNVEVAEGNDSFIVENKCLYNADKTELIMCFTKESEVNIADETTRIKNYAFMQATNIENVNFDGNITTIGSQVFWYSNKKLKKVYIGAGVTNIDPIFKYKNNYGTVTVDEANQNYSSENNEIYNKDKTELIGIYHDIQGSYTVRSSVTKIGDRAFHSKNQMTEVILPNGLKEIGSSFSYCTGLTEIYIPNTVDKIASDAFLNSTNLMHIRIDKAPNTIEGAPWGAISWDRAVEWLRPAE
ncbi:MAG: leucine-rich repeat domain-containing protein, partial [Clostridia bacterium]|nr:leucine-rich repeat domain-containing protein [Clostridia bacterium]